MDLLCLAIILESRQAVQTRSWRGHITELYNTNSLVFQDFFFRILR